MEKIEDKNLKSFFEIDKIVEKMRSNNISYKYLYHHVFGEYHIELFYSESAGKIRFSIWKYDSIGRLKTLYLLQYSLLTGSWWYTKEKLEEIKMVWSLVDLDKMLSEVVK